MCESFLCGSNRLVEKSLEGAYGAMEDLESQAKQLTKEATGKVVSVTYFS